MIIVGIDWARCKHDYLLMAPTGEILQRGRIPHNAAGLQELAATIERHAGSDRNIRVGIEMNDGALLAWLIEKGYTVFGIQPKSSQRAREIYRPGGGKDDPVDTFVLAEMVRLSSDRLRPLRPDSPATEELRGLLRWRQELVHQRTAATQRLRAVLAEWSPRLSELCDDLERNWQLDLLQEFATEALFCQAHGNRIRGFVRKHHLRHQTYKKIEDVRRAGPMPLPAGRVLPVVRRVQCLVEQIRQLSAQIDRIERGLEERVAQHPDADLFRSLPIRATVTVASLLSLFGENREQAPSWEELAARCGVAPVTKASGKTKTVRQRRACDHTFHQALIYFAFNTAFAEGCWAGEFYQRKRRDGLKHYASLRCLAKRWMKILYRVWKDRLTYNEQLHRRNQKCHEQQAA
jgi:transposase